jgi:hypothetical protein
MTYLILITITWTVTAVAFAGIAAILFQWHKDLKNHENKA